MTTTKWEAPKPCVGVPLDDSCVLDQLPVAVCVCDRDGRIVRFNECARQLWGREPGSDERYCGSQRMFRSDGAAVPHDRSPMARALGTGQPVHDVEILIERPNAPRLAVVAHADPVFDRDGGLAGAVCAMQLANGNTHAGAEDGSRAKDDLLATVAHELRQPIHAAVAALGVMAQRPGRERGLNARATVERQIRQMNHIVEDLLHAERIVRGEVELHLERVDIRTTVRQVAEAVGPLLVERQQRFEIDLGEAPIPVQVDEARIQQVLMNVLTNATKYTPPEGQVALRLADLGDTLAISVADNGRGIDPSAVSRIFELFSRDASDSRGFGVGLAVARRLVELHGGRIAARSDGRGHGSEFVISLPTARAQSH